MRGRKLLAAFLLGVGLCFVPALGYGEIKTWMNEAKASYMEVFLLEARVSYMMANPTNFLYVKFYYDPDGGFGRITKLPGYVDTTGKLFVDIVDTRDVFSYKSRIALLDEFKKKLEVISSYINHLATDMNADIVAVFYSQREILLGYFYQGEYHLWGE